jgi:hypothetical protein
MLGCLDTLQKLASAIGSEQFSVKPTTRNGEALLTKNWAMKIAHARSLTITPGSFRPNTRAKSETPTLE